MSVMSSRDPLRRRSALPRLMTPSASRSLIYIRRSSSAFVITVQPSSRCCSLLQGVAVVRSVAVTIQLPPLLRGKFCVAVSCLRHFGVADVYTLHLSVLHSGFSRRRFRNLTHHRFRVCCSQQPSLHCVRSPSSAPVSATAAVPRNLSAASSPRRERRLVAENPEQPSP